MKRLELEVAWCWRALVGLHVRWPRRPTAFPGACTRADSREWSIRLSARKLQGTHTAARVMRRKITKRPGGRTSTLASFDTLPMARTMVHEQERIATVISGLSMPPGMKARCTGLLEPPIPFISNLDFHTLHAFSADVTAKLGAGDITGTLARFVIAVARQVPSWWCLCFDV